jgi:hypothetical protein
VALTVDGFVHLDLTAEDPLLDISARLTAAGRARALLVETWKGEDFHLLERLRASREDRFQLAFCFRPGKPMANLWADPSVVAIRVRGSELPSAGDLLDHLVALEKYLLVHSDEGIGPLTDRILELVSERPSLKVYFPHLAWPVVDAREDPDWRSCIIRLAACPTAAIGISAIRHFSREEFPHPDVRRYVEEILLRFQPHRIIAGSDYPLFDQEKYADYMNLAIDWIRERYPEWVERGA